MEPKTKKVIYYIDVIAISLESHFLIFDVENEWFTEISIPLTSLLTNVEAETEKSVRDKVIEWRWPADDDFDLVYLTNDAFANPTTREQKFMWTTYVEHMFGMFKTHT